MSPDQPQPGPQFPGSSSSLPPPPQAPAGGFGEPAPVWNPPLPPPPGPAGPQQPTLPGDQPTGRGKGKNWLVIGISIVVAIAGVFAIISGIRTIAGSTTTTTASGTTSTSRAGSTPPLALCREIDTVVRDLQLDFEPGVVTPSAKKQKDDGAALARQAIAAGQPYSGEVQTAFSTGSAGNTHAMLADLQVLQRSCG